MLPALFAATPDISIRAQTVTVRSQSEQFIVTSPVELPPYKPPVTEINRPQTIRLHPTLVPVMAERIKLALLQTLGWRDQWKNRVFINLHPTRDFDDAAFVNATYTGSGWMYQVNLPADIVPARLIQVLVEVLVQEMADRPAGAKSAELPPWLTIGLAAHVRARVGASLAVEMELAADLRTTHGGVPVVALDNQRSRPERFVDPMQGVHARLSQHQPLSWEQLNWPAADQLEAGTEGLYADCAHLCVLELLRLPDGAACMGTLLEQLPHHLNWQFAFLQAFQRHFSSLRDADKWWTLLLVNTTGRDPARTWNYFESLGRLEDILRAPIQVRAATNAIPQPGALSLQAMLSQSEFSRQKSVLRQKITQLLSLRRRISPEILNLTDDYRQTLQKYLDRRTKSGATSDSPRLILKQAIQQLDALDQVREDLRTAGPQPATPLSEPADVATNLPPVNFKPTRRRPEPRPPIPAQAPVPSLAPHRAF